MHRQGQGQAGSQQLAVYVLGLERNIHAPANEDREQDQYRSESHQSHFFPDGGQNKVRLGHWHILGKPGAEPGTGYPAGGHAEQGLGKLVAGGVVVPDWVEEVRESILNLARNLVDGGATYHNQNGADEQPRYPVCR